MTPVNSSLVVSDSLQGTSETNGVSLVDVPEPPFQSLPLAPILHRFWPVMKVSRGSLFSASKTWLPGFTTWVWLERARSFG